jgi:hypothetical protein
VGLGRRRRGARAAGQGLDAAEAEAGSEAGRSAGPGREACRKTSRKEASADLKTSRVVRRVPSQRSEV